MEFRALQKWSVPALALVGLLLSTGFAAAQPRARQGQQLYNWSGDYRGYGQSNFWGPGNYYSAPYSYGVPYSYSYASPNFVPFGNATTYSNAMPFSPNYGYAAFNSNAMGYYGAPSLEDQVKERGAVLVHMNVPADAQIWFNDTPTWITGPSRDFISPPVASGRDYWYQIRAIWKEGDRTLDQARTVNVHAGETVNLDFPERGKTEKSEEGKANNPESEKSEK
jgi:uncharacterized protein (TIGR03000 family)